MEPAEVKSYHSVSFLILVKDSNPTVAPFGLLKLASILGSRIFDFRLLF
jgi:hypothetical protein